MKQKISTGLIWLVHLSAIIGITLGYTEWFVTKTPLNLLLIFILVVLNFPIDTRNKWVIFGICFMAGFLTEWLGVHYGVPFGEYFYGFNLGFKIDGVPLLIGINWAVLVFITGAIATAVFPGRKAKVIAGAALMLLLDFFMEGVAPVFDFWSFATGTPPVQNFISWFVLAALLHILYQEYAGKGNVRFSLHVYAAQLVFFLYFFLRYGL